MAKKNSDSMLWWFIASGIGLILVGCFLVYQQLKFINQSASSNGTITELKAYKSQRQSSSSPSYCPVTQFTTATGELVKFESSMCSYPPSFQVGDKVNVLYPPSNPEQAQINTFWQLWFNSVLVTGLGILFTAVSWLFHKFL